MELSHWKIIYLGFLRQQNLEVHMCVHSEDEPKYKRKWRLRREMMERLRAEKEAEGALQMGVSGDFSALNHDHMEMVKSRKSEVTRGKKKAVKYVT